MRLITVACLVGTMSAPSLAQVIEIPTVVQVGVFNVYLDGSVGGYAVDTGERPNESFSALVWTGNGGCSVGAADIPGVDIRQPLERATDAWEIRGQVTSMAAEHASVQVEWRRLRVAGAAAEGAWSSRQVTVPLNELVALDAPIAATGECAPRSITFGTRFLSRIAGVPGFVGRGIGSGSGSGWSSSGSGTVAATRTRRVPPYTAELWLVHSVPGKPETVLPAKVRVDNGAATFSFARMQLPVTGGLLDVTISGGIQLVAGDQRPRMFTFKADRTASFTPANRLPRDPVEPRFEGGASVSSNQMPEPNDVLEFEMPPLKVAGAPSLPDKFAIRLRLRPLDAGQ